MVDKNWAYVLDEASLPEGGMSPVYPKGINILLARVNGEVYALDGKILICAMHNAQFDVITGEALSSPVPRDFGKETPPPRMAKYLSDVAMLMNHIKTNDIHTYETKVETGIIWVAV